MGQADFTIAGTPFSQRGYDATSGQVIALQLAEQPPKVNACTFSVFTFSDGAPAATVANGGVASPPGAAVSLTMPTVGSADAHSYMVQCSVTLPDGTTIVARRIIAIRNSLGFRKMCPTETVEYDPTFAWTEVVNDTVDLASTYAPLQAVNIDIGTEPANVTIDIGNGADTVTVDTNDLNLNAANILALAAPAVRLGGAAASDRLTVSGAFSIITADVPDGTIFNVRSDVFGIYEAAQATPSFTFSCDADAASSLTLGAGTTVSILQSQSLSGAGRTLTIRGQQGQAGQVGGNLDLGSGLGGTAGTNAPGNIKLRVGAQAGGQTGHVLLTDESSGDTDFLRMRRVGTATYVESLAGDLNLSATAAAQVIATSTMVFRGTGCYFDANTLYTRTNGLALKETVTVADTFDRNYASGVYPQWSINGGMRMRYNASGFYVASPNSFNSFEVQDAGISLSHANGYVDITGGGSPGVTLNTTDTTAAISSVNSALLRRSITGRVYRREFVYTVQTTNATPVYLTYTTTSNTGYRVRLDVQASNDTDNEFASYATKEGAWKNVSGTLTNVGGVDKIGSDYSDASLVTATSALNTSGTTIRAELTGIAGKTINWNIIMTFLERVIT